MPVKIRLMRIGSKKHPFYRVVAVDERKKRTGGYLELLGTYNPLTEPKEIKLNQEKIDAWIKNGAQPSEGFLRIIGKAPQRPPRKPKKAPKEEAKAAPVVEVETKETKESDESKESEEVVVESTESQEPEAEKSAEETTSEPAKEPDEKQS